MPSLKQLLADPQTAWTTVEVSWYSQKRQTVEACSQTTLWCTQGHDSLPIRWLLVRDPQGEFKPTAFMSTDLSLTPERILRFFIGRWGLEVTFQEACQQRV